MLKDDRRRGVPTVSMSINDTKAGKILGKLLWGSQGFAFGDPALPSPVLAPIPQAQPTPSTLLPGLLTSS